MRTSTVGVRELKTRLGGYLQRVKNGERLIVTDRGQPAAAIVPIAGGRRSFAARIARLEGEGLITRPRASRLLPFEPVRVKGSALAEAIIEERESGW
jgi:prevent-host-death family protein